MPQKDRAGRLRAAAASLLIITTAATVTVSFLLIAFGCREVAAVALPRLAPSALAQTIPVTPE